ncbi:MAG: hypothetical protein OXT01_21610, partial [Rhodospirillaceae bacterium]|nr:hypothetical protein [Rhodospirillaceae bacterium]
LNTATLDGIGMTLDGATIDAGNLSTTTLVGNIDFNNNAALNVESNGSNTDIVIDGTVTLSGDGTGTVTLDDTSNLERARILGDNNGILRNAVTIQGEVQLGVDSLEIRNLAGGVIQANVTGQELIIDPNAAGMTNEGTVLATNNSTLRVQDGTMTNAGGRVEVDTGSVILFTSSGEFVQDSGETVLNGGTLESKGTAAQFNGGVLSGSGTVAGGAVFAAGATIAAGASPGIIDFSDDSVFNGLIEIEIAGLLLDGGAPNAGEINTATDPATTQFDQLNVFGLAELVAGLTIDVSLLGGAALSTGDFFDIMTADLFQVDLGLINFILPSDFSISLVTLPDFLFGGQDRQALRLAFNGQSVEPTGVPEPGMFALFLIALIGIGAMRYRAMA